MSIRAVLACNGEQAHERCRQAVPVGEVLTASQARHEAKTIFGWSSAVENGTVNDYCPSCTKRRTEAASRPTCRCMDKNHGLVRLW